MKAFMAFPLCSLLFISVLAIAYFLKPKVKTLEMRVYKNLIVSVIVGLILELLCYVAVDIINDHYLIATIILKLYVVYIFVWTMVFNMYVYLVTGNYEEGNEKSQTRYMRLKTITVLICCIICLIVFFLPIYVFDDGKFCYSYGPAINFVILLLFIVGITWFILCIRHFEKLKRKKYIPIIACIVVLSLVLCIQSYDRSILICTTGHAIIVLLMYFTIENPDVRMIEQLNVAKSQAEKANAAKTDFLSNMSHEIRTPLNAIVGFSNLLLEDKSVPESAKEEINDIVMASDNLLEIVNGILDISKIEANKLEIINSEYDVGKLLNELVTLSRGRIADKPLEFRTNFDQSLPQVLYGDASRIKQICVNILTNAIKYTKEGWVEFKVSSIIKDNICRLIISVEDTGIGIKNENIDKLFNKFERLDLEENVTIEGTGLGLAITKKLVDLMQGKIVVQSVFGKGSKFTVSIDQRIVKNPTIKLEETKPTESVIVNNKKVLLVDDNKINLKVAERLLDAYGLEVEAVESGFACLEKIKSGCIYDLILLDDMMPKMSGVETLKKLKEIDDFNIKTVALTANALTGMREKYLADGFDDYLAKPINKDELNKIINKYLNDN